MKENIVEFRNFSFRYQSQTETTLKSINLTIRGGENSPSWAEWQWKVYVG